jgi:hypothetical protein
MQSGASRAQSAGKAIVTFFEGRGRPEATAAETGHDAGKDRNKSVIPMRLPPCDRPTGVFLMHKRSIGLLWYSPLTSNW